MNLTKTGKNMEGAVVLEFSPKYSTAESYASWKRECSAQTSVRPEVTTYPRDCSNRRRPARFFRRPRESEAAQRCCWGTSAAPGSPLLHRTPSWSPPCLAPELARPAGCCPEKLQTQRVISFTLRHWTSAEFISGPLIVCCTVLVLSSFRHSEYICFGFKNILLIRSKISVSLH